MPKISVVVPMYNAEKFLDVTVASILDQTFKDFELILVDDCSTDKTLDVAKNFGDDRIQILQTEKNLGYPGATRNVGFDAAIGEYVYFMDHDDTILPNAFEVLVKVAEKSGADVVTTWQWYSSNDFTNSDDIQVDLIQLNSPSNDVSENFALRLWNEMILRGLHVAPWCSFYRRKFLIDNNIKFPAEVAEDVFFTVDVVAATSKIVKIKFPFYIWRNSKGSASHDLSRVYKNMESMLHLCDYLQKKLEPIDDETYKAEFIFNLLDGAINCYLAPFFSVNENTALEALDEVTKALKPRFGENTFFVRAILHGYFQGRNAINQHYLLKKKLGYID